MKIYRNFYYYFSCYVFILALSTINVYSMECESKELTNIESSLPIQDADAFILQEIINNSNDKYLLIIAPPETLLGNETLEDLKTKLSSSDIAKVPLLPNNSQKINKKFFLLVNETMSSATHRMYFPQNQITLYNTATNAQLLINPQLTRSAKFRTGPNRGDVIATYRCYLNFMYDIRSYILRAEGTRPAKRTVVDPVNVQKEYYIKVDDYENDQQMWPEGAKKTAWQKVKQPVGNFVVDIIIKNNIKDWELDLSGSIAD